MLASPQELRYFIEVAQTLNLSRASERLGISQPSLSIAIKRLETGIGTQLLMRHKKGVHLTPAGKRLLTHAKQLLQLWDTLKNESLAAHQEVEGSIRLGCHPSVALYSLPHFLPALFGEYPKLEVQLKHDISRKIVEEVINLSLDVGIVVNPIKHPDLIMQKLYEDKIYFWTASDMSNVETYVKSGEAVIICDPELMQTQWLLKRIQKDGIKYQRLITSSSLEVIGSLTMQQSGIGIIPRSVTLTQRLSLTPILKLPHYADEIFLIYRHENRHIKAVRTVVNSIKTHYT